MVDWDVLRTGWPVTIRTRGFLAARATRDRVQRAGIRAWMTRVKDDWYRVDYVLPYRKEVAA
jgi:hypothetical protein